jgi:hypothetical protein
MAKKAKQAPPKKRKSEKAAPKAEEGKVLGTVSIPVQVSIFTGDVANFNELVIEWSCLGLSEEPDTITETSGNGRLLDPKRPPTTSEEGLHVYLDPPQPGGHYGFQFHFGYNDAIEARTAAPEEDKDKAASYDEEAA